MVDDVLYLFAIELVEDGHSHSAVGECGEVGHSPVGRVPSADGYLVALLHVAVLKQDMQFFYLAGYVVKLEGDTLIVRQGILIPVLYDGTLYIDIKTTESLH